MAAEMRTAVARLGFSNNAAVELVNTQTIDSIEELRFLTDEEVHNLCKVIRNPGGSIPNPAIAAAANATEAAAVQPRTVPNPGEPVPLRAENNLKLAAYWLRFKAKTSRTVAAADVTVDNVRSIRGLRDWEEQHEDPDVPENLISTRDWTKTIETMEEYIRGFLGVSGIPLSYVLRKETAPEANPTNGWPSLQDEMIGRAPIVDTGTTNHTEDFKTDNHRVWELLASITREHECWTYIKSYQRKRDGRGAFWALHNHYLGPNNLDNLAASAERKLQTTTYSGERKRWTFERYVRMHTEQHTILTGFTDQGYSGIDERSKVRRLIDGIKTKEFDAVKAQVMSSAALRNDFEGTVTLYKDFIAQAQTEPRIANISSVQQTRGKGTRRSADGEVTIEAKDIQDRYYSAKEYRLFTPEARTKLAKLREARGHQPKKRKSEDRSVSIQQVSLDPMSVSALATEIASVSVSTKKQRTKEKEQGNRNHPAVTRQLPVDDDDRSEGNWWQVLAQDCWARLTGIVKTITIRLDQANISAIRTVRISPIMTSGHESTTELDSHADTCVVGSNALILTDHCRPVKVTGYDTSKGATTYSTVDVAIAYDDPKSGTTRILVVNQAIHIPQIRHNLLSPMQMRLSDVRVNEEPKFLAVSPDEGTHAITVPDATASEDPLVIPLGLKGVTSYFPSRKPTLIEYESSETDSNRI